MTSPQNYLIDGFVGSLAIKAPVNVATTINITLSGEQTVNTVALLEDDRCLVKDQTDPVENGIYTVKDSAWERAPDFDGQRDVVSGTMITVELPSNDFEIYQVTTANPITIGTTGLTIEMFLASSMASDLQSVTDLGSTTTNSIDALEMILNEQAALGNPGAGKGRIYVRNTAPTTAWFIDDTGATIQLGGGTGISNVVEDTTPDLGGNLGCDDNEVQKPLIKDYGMISTSPSSSSGVLTLDLENGNDFDVTLTENITSIVISNPSPTGNYCEFNLSFTQDGTGGWTVTGYPAGTIWVGGGTEPTITTTATTGSDDIHGYTRDAGTSWRNTSAQDFS